MHRPSFRGAATARSGKLPRPGLETVVFGVRLLIAFALPSHVLAHEAHPTAQAATAAVPELIKAVNDESFSTSSAALAALAGMGLAAKPAVPVMTNRFEKLKPREDAGDYEREAILTALNSTRWNRKQAAALLKIDYKALLYKMKKLGVEDAALPAVPNGEARAVAMSAHAD